MTVLLTSNSELETWLSNAPGPRAVVLTMGALHDGHMALVERARSEAPDGSVLLTVFVNPAQFGPGEDFECYPRTLDHDLELCTKYGVDAVFAPAVEDVYPANESVPDFDPGPLADELEGKARPGHFAGVLKVVARLLRLTRADVTCFGEKDYQQLVVVQQLNALDPALRQVRFIGVPIKRDGDGLALSSRNRYLSEVERQQALAIPRCVELVQQACSSGISAQSAALEGFTALLESPGVSVDYVTVRSVDLGPAPLRGQGRVLIAAKVGTTRLLDNGPVTLGGGG